MNHDNRQNILTHFDEAGAARIVDISHKNDTSRRAVATGLIRMQASTLALIKAGQVKKGDILNVARIAAIMGAKKTSDLIPLCHSLFLTHVAVDFSLEDNPPAVRCQACVETCGKTGVEMEALTAVQIALLTIYDMAKSIDRGMMMTNVQLLQKQGGKSGEWSATLIDADNKKTSDAI